MLTELSRDKTAAEVAAEGVSASSRDASCSWLSVNEDSSAMIAMLLPSLRPIQVRHVQEVLRKSIEILKRHYRRKFWIFV